MTLPYQLKKSWSARSLRLRLNKNGQLIVSAPSLTPQFIINRFIDEHESWILNKQNILRQKQLAQNSSIAIFGQNYQLVFTYHPDLAIGFIINNHQLLYNNSHYLLHPKTDSSLSLQETNKLEKFLRQTINSYIQERTPILHQKMQIKKPLGRIIIKDQASRWGSCSSLGNLNFNYNLVHYPPEVIDYVIIHELAHLVHLDHSAAFWALVAKYDGRYQAHRRALKS